MQELPNTDNLKISSLEEVVEIIKLLIVKIKEVENRESVRDQGLIEEILHLRKETHEGFQGMNRRLDELTLQSKTHSTILKEHSSILKEHSSILKEHSTSLKSIESTMKGGFDNVGKILQEISNKLDK